MDHALKARSSEDPLAEMLQLRGDARGRFEELRRDLAAVGRLFGSALQQQLQDRLEVAADRYEDALLTAAEAMNDAERRVSSAQTRATLMAARVSELQGAVVDAALEVQRRYGVARNPVPDELLQLIEVGGTAWAFVYPPADARHEHDYARDPETDLGECRHPLCTAQTALEIEEPF